MFVSHHPQFTRRSHQKIHYTFDYCGTHYSIIAYGRKSTTKTFCSNTPKTKVSSHLHPKWFNSEIRHSLHIIHSLRRKVRSNTSPYLICTMMLEAKTQFEKELITDPTRHHRKLFGYLRHLSKSSQIPQQVYLDDLRANTPAERANLFNKYFNSVYLPKVDEALDNFNFSTSSFPQLHHAHTY